jgi:hypothetical protein
MPVTRAPRSTFITSTLTPDERDALYRLADQEGMPVSTLVRRLVRQAISPLTTTTDTLRSQGVQR